MDRDLLIWMAGFFDGEGCVSIGRGVHKNHATHPTKDSYCLAVIVGQKERGPLELFVEAFGGALYHHRVKGMLYHRWLVSSNKAAAALIQMLPYLRVKRPIAELAIRFQEEMSAGNRQYGRRGYPDHIREARAVYYHEAKRLNARNRPDPNAPAYEGPREQTVLRAVNEE